MPRIDPERLLKCLQPLLEPISGAIRSTDEVDKILGLMSKFSKKLVSKCIYINILRASHQSVVDLFMERGGWNLVFGWTNDAIANKNYSLLKEIFHLLVTVPVTVPRLKSNRFPIVLKNFSKDCEDEETKHICKQVVSRWIAVAKTEEVKTEQPQQQQPVPPAPPPNPPIQIPEQQHLETLASTQPQHIQLIDPTAAASGVGNTAGELPNLGSMNTDHLLNIDPASMSMIPDTDGGAHQSLMDLDLTNSELAGIDFNLDILNKMVEDGHMEDIGLSQQIIGGSDMNTVEVAAAPTNVVSAPISVIQHAPAQLQPQMQQQHIIHQQQQHHPQQQHQIILEQQHVQIQQQQQHPQIIQHSQQLVSGNVIPTTANVIFTSAHPQQQHLQQQPQQIIIQQQQPQQTIIKDDPQQILSLVPVQPQNKIFIKTVGGQPSVVQNFANDPGQYCLMVKDGKSYLVRLKERSNVTNVVVTTANSPVTSVVVQQQQQQPQQHNIQHTAMLSEVPDGSNNKVPPLIISSHHDTPDGAAPPSANLKKINKSPSKKDPQIVSPVNKVPGEIQKTYSKSSSSSSSSKDGKKSSSENVKPSSGSSDKDRHKSSSSSSSKSKSSSSDSHHHKKSSKSKAESAASKAAAAAAAAKEEERLKEKIRREKAQMKKRQKELAKQNEQTKKDQETLKKLNLIPVPSGSTTSSSASSSANASPTPSSTLKIGKIPKKNVSSFADAIGIPGSDGSSSAADKIKKISPEKSSSKEKSPAAPQNEDVVPTSPQKKFYGKKEEEAAAEENKPKERRHNVKVFNRSKSRADDLLKEMTESGIKGSKSTNKDKEQKDKEKEEKEKEGKASGSGLNFGNSIPATPPKIPKRLSTDSLEKPGDVKKAKLETVKDKSSSGGKESIKDKIKKMSAPAAIKLKESSMFMEAISAGAETAKTSKKKRRTSSGGEKDAPKLGELSGEGEDVATTPTGEKEQEQVKKPVFNFYRDTLNDEDSETSENKAVEGGEGSEAGKTEGDDKMDEDASESGSFTPQENDGKVKSALVLIRPRNRKKKYVRWREEDELREFHYFEMDETERVNVTKQKDFTELSSNEKAMEGSFLKRRAEEEEQGNNKNEKPWKMRKTIFTREILNPPIISTEREAQEEREKNVLGLFLPPGAAKPDSAEEADQNIDSAESKQEPKPIPVEDVNTITKVCDYRTHEWPEPKGGPTFGMTGMMMGRSGYGFPPPLMQQQQQQQRNPMEAMVASSLSFPQSSQYPPQMVPNPTLSPTTTQQSADYNPWSANLGFGVPPTGVPPPSTATDMGGFGQFNATAAAAVLNMNLMGQGVPPPAAPVVYPHNNPFAFPPPPTAMMNGPPPGIPPAGGIMDYGTGNNHRGGGSNSNHRGGGSRFDGNDRRGNFHASRDNSRDKERSTSRDRDYRDDRGGGGRDRDYRRGGADRSGGSERDHRNHHDRDNRNNRDFRGSGGGRNIRKEIPCRFFKKGFCGNGSRCEFLHEGGPSSSRDSHDRSSTASRRSPPSEQHTSSRHQSSTSSSNSNSNDDDDWETPANSIPDSAQSPPQEEQTVNPHHQPRTPTSRFSDAPLSPTDDSPSSPVGNFGAAAEAGTKVIPV